MKINTYLNFSGNAEDALTFYKSVFGGEFANVTRYSDLPMEGFTVPTADESKMMHISLPIGQNFVLQASDVIESSGQKLVQGNNVIISLQAQSKEEADKLFTGLSAGGMIDMPMADQVWGDYYGSFTDKFGVHWMVDYTYPKE